jgi:GTP-binding protein HflX
MADLKRRELSLGTEKALLVGLVPPGEDWKEELLNELASLARTAGAQVVGKESQVRSRIDPAFYIGKGKAQQLAQKAQAGDVDTIIFDNDLSLAQVRNLEQLTQTKVIDRSELILDIFATHARTRQAKLQVELAQLEYTLPRLRGMWTHLSRFEGGIGTRGPGEQQLEVDRRLASRRINDLKRQLKRIERRKVREVKKRGQEITVSLVGYTNAGKSTLMNALTRAGVLVEDKLFATLDTRTRRWELRSGKKVLLSDTVGFIRGLPHHLIAAFRATLEEARNADMLLHIADLGSRQVLHQVATVEEVLEDLGCKDVPTMLVLNKVDIMADPVDLEILKRKYSDYVVISALTGQGQEALKERIVDYLERKWQHFEILCPSDDGRVLAYLCENGEVLSKRFGNEESKFVVRLHPGYIAGLKRLNGSVRVNELVPPASDPSSPLSGEQGGYEEKRAE